MYLVECYDILFASFPDTLLTIKKIKSRRRPINIFKIFFKWSDRSAHCLGDCLPEFFLCYILQKLRIYKIEGKSIVQLVWIGFERCFSRNLMAIFIATLLKSDFLEFHFIRRRSFYGCPTIVQ